MLTGIEKKEKRRHNADPSLYIWYRFFGLVIPIDQAGANLFFQLISRRYEKGPVILTSNQSFGSWGEVFGDRVIATAILDRVLHHAITINIRGNSYRLKDKLKAGLIRAVEPTVN